MVAASHRQEPNEGNLHTSKRAQSIPGSIADIQPRAEPSHANQYERMQRQQVRDEDISTPRADHVSVKQRAKSSPHHTAFFYCLDPQIEREDEQEDGDCLIVIAPSHGS